MDSMKFDHNRLHPRVCFLTEIFSPPTPGGQALFAAQLAEGLTAAGLGVSVVTRQTEPPSTTNERVGNVDVRRIPPAGHLKARGWTALIPMLVFLARIFAFLISNVRNYDVILLMGAKILPIVAVVVRMICRKRVLIRIESPVELAQGISAESLQKMGLSQSSLFFRVIRTVQTSVLRRADGIIAISPEIRENLLALGIDPLRIHSVPNGIDGQKFCPVSTDVKMKVRQKLALPTDKIIVTYTGRLAVSKGLPILIGIWPTLQEKFPDLHLVLVGSDAATHDSCMSGILQQIRHHQLERSVTLAGEVDNVHEYLQASDLYVFPSEYEGFGLSMVEALACGLPAVVTDVGIASELIQSGVNGLIVPPKKDIELLMAMTWLLDHQECWPAMREKARAAVLARYDLSVCLRKHDELILALSRRDESSVS
jgi:glycosyltransferase involved in cell wall biosynthesis